MYMTLVVKLLSFCFVSLIFHFLPIGVNKGVRVTCVCLRVAAGDHKGVRRARRLRVAVNRSRVVSLTAVVDALAQSCRRYYLD